MPLKLTNHNCPFSHLLGESCLIPYSSWKMTAYPTRIYLENLDRKEEKIIFSLQITGPIINYTLFQDLERDFVRICGIAKEGYFAFRIAICEERMELLLERCPDEGILFLFPEEEKRLKRKERYLLRKGVKTSPDNQEKIHFGSHKKQDWPLVKRRLKLEEILPIWFAIGQKSPLVEPHFEGAASLLKQCSEKILKRDRLAIGRELLTLFQVGFSGIFTPRLLDTDYQGVIEDQSISEKSPLVLLSFGAALIRRLFIDYQDDHLEILPCLPVELHAGECIQLNGSKHLSIDLKWSKKTLRQLILYPKKDQKQRLVLPKEIKTFRLDGKSLKRNELLDLKKGKLYVLDRFQS
jgi:hypothetical protein